MLQFDELITSIGELGRYQVWIFILVCLGTLPCAFIVNIPLFLMPQVKHRCSIPVLKNDSYLVKGTYHRHLLNHSLPLEYNDKACVFQFSECKVFQGSDNKTKLCEKWVFDQSIFTSTATEEFSLVCDRKEWRTYLLMATMIGMLIGSLVFGTLADRFGRKRTLTLVNIAGILIGVVSAWSPNIPYFFFYRLLLGMCATGIYLPTFVLVMEIVGPTKRMWAGVCINFFWAVGVLVLDGFSFAIRDWQYLQLLCSLFGALFIPLICIIPESPRWLIANGRLKDGMDVVEKIAKFNGTDVSSKFYQSSPNADKDDHADRSIKIWHLCESPVLAVRSVVIVINWIAVTLAYYGLLMYAGSMSSDLHLNFFLNGLIEFPAYAICLFLINRIGRRILHSSSMILSGVACICSIFPVVFTPKEQCQTGELNVATLVLSLVGRLGAACGFASIYVFSSELFPTTLRNSAMGFSSMMARVGGIASPYIATLNVGGKFGPAFPLLIFGVISLIAGILSVILPETLNQQLPDTIDEAKKFGRKSKSPKNNFYNINRAFELT